MPGRGRSYTRIWPCVLFSLPPPPKGQFTGEAGGSFKLFGEADASLVGVEEPENHVHPSALRAFAEYLRDASERAQILVTTHSPLLLDCLPKPEEVAVVRRTPDGTTIEREQHPEAVDAALDASGFGLGEFYETKGFGA
ncbi:AAA family ATPase [Sorangium sp. So ce590]|uniref:AAA family ATPase n=1 Tax=Sorangium sp. So ce590 TaxID=3133317 RepID=UPI003F61E115